VPRRYKYLARALRSKYWMPGCEWVDEVLKCLKRAGVREGDIVVVSEKAISVAEGNVVDESAVEPGFVAKLLARFWMRVVWGYLLGVACRLRRETLEFLRSYPLDYGARHKQVALSYAGPLHALCFGSEGGIDGSNLPYAYVCLPLRDPQERARELRRAIERALGIKVAVVISDSDRCYVWKSVCICPRPTSVKGIVSGLGIIAYLIGNLLGLRSAATPIAVSGGSFNLEELLSVTNVAERRRGHGAGRSVWEMARRFGTSLTGVTWEMLSSIPHYPVVLVRRRGK